MRQMIFKHQQLLRFALVGGVGFVADSLIFATCVYGLHLPLMQARVIAFVCAATVTWAGNRVFTFTSVAAYAPGNKWRQWQKFMLTAAISALPNLAIFQLMVHLVGAGGWHALLALVAGVLAGMLSNYCLSQRWVFAASE